MGRYLKFLWYIFTARWSVAANVLQSNRYVMEATYDRSISKTEERLKTVKDAVAGLIAIKIKKSDEMKKLTEKLEKLGHIKRAAGEKLKKRAEVLVEQLKSQGVTDPSAIKSRIGADAEYLKHFGAFNDASSSFEEVQERFAALEKEVSDRDTEIANYKVELQSMQRRLQSLREEKHEAIADVTIAQQAESVKAVMAGISEDSTDKDLADVREARKKAVASSQIMSELAGNEAKVAESEYLSYSKQLEANSEIDKFLNLDAMIGGTEKLEPAKLPE